MRAANVARLFVDIQQTVSPSGTVDISALTIKSISIQNYR